MVSLLTSHLVQNGVLIMVDLTHGPEGTVILTQFPPGAGMLLIITGSTVTIVLQLILIQSPAGKVCC
jgi:hypothetical protein